MDRTERTLLTLALAMAAGPAAASDFRGFFSIFLGMPMLALVGLVAGFILLRRLTAAKRGATRFTPLVLMVVAMLPLALPGIFMGRYAWFGIPLLLGAWLVAARWIWLNPRGNVAVWLARALLVLALATAGFMVWDTTTIMSNRVESPWVMFAVVMAVQFVVCFGLCLLAARRRVTA